MAIELSQGSIQKIYETGDTTETPTLQIWDVKRIGASKTPPSRSSLAAASWPSVRRPRRRDGRADMWCGGARR